MRWQAARAEVTWRRLADEVAQAGPEAPPIQIEQVREELPPAIRVEPTTPGSVLLGILRFAVAGNRRTERDVGCNPHLLRTSTPNTFSVGAYSRLHLQCTDDKPMSSDFYFSRSITFTRLAFSRPVLTTY
eukprot:1607613-Pyramimonas_sp.AAC.3